jgi:ArsR family transcriptional regulator, arsenate/arsenite/antimonite-responsive transcriptional repressor
MKPDLPATAALFRALGHPVRLAILMELAAGPKCVTDIQELVDAPQANVSQHLAVLRHARLIDFHEDGKLRCYYVARPGLLKVLLRLIHGEYPVRNRSKESVRRATSRRREEEGSSCTMAKRKKGAAVARAR